MTLTEHLEELRNRLLISIGAIAVGAAGGWLLYSPVLRLLRQPFCDTLRHLPRSSRPPTDCNFIFTSPVDAVVIKLKVVVFLGLLIALPIVLYQLWAFIVPGLTSREQRLAIPFIASSMLLFLGGVSVAYVTMPKALGFLLGFAGPGFTPLLSASQFLSFVILVALAFGISFEFPIVLIFLCLAGVLSSRKLRDWRRGAILFIAVFAAVITPSADPYSMLGMMIPMVVLYEVAILMARWLKK